MIKLQKNLFQGDGYLTQLFGQNPDWYAKFGLKGHNGIDYGIPTGRELYSCINGKVIEAQLDASGYGNYIKIENDGCGVLYGHLQVFKVKVGNEVKAGQLIGLSDNTGNSTGPHLHFGVFPKPRDRSNGYAGYINPLDKTLVTWVESLNEPDEINTLKGKIAELEKELSEMRESRNKWRTKCEELEAKYTKDMQEQLKYREAMQKDMAELNLAVTQLRDSQAEFDNKLDAKESEIETITKELEVLKIAYNECEAENKRLSDKLKGCNAEQINILERFLNWLKGGA